MKPIDYHIIGSGSTGNAVRIGKIMFDCGVAFGKMKEDLYKCDTLCITHSHTDHIKPAIYKHIRQTFPRIKVYANADVAYQYDVDKVIGTAPFTLPGGRRVIPFDGVHDVPVTGYIVQEKGINYLYMTDTASINLPVKLPLDYIFLESNYDEIKIKEVAKEYKTGRYDPYKSSTMRHLSTQQCKAFYYMHRRNEDSQLIELHKSKRFY